MTDQFYTAERTLARLHAGPLGSHIDTFAALLSERGYARSTIRCQLRLLADLSHWLEDRGLQMEDLSEERIRESIEDSPRDPEFICNYQAVFRALLEHLRGAGLVPAPKSKRDDSGVGRTLHDFGQYLAQERGLSQATLETYLPLIKCFLTERFGAEAVSLQDLCAADVTHFVLRHAHAASHSRAKLMVTALRGFFRFLRLRGHIVTDLAAAVPTVANWRLSILPQSLAPEQIDRLLKSCDRDTVVGQRDYAILLLLARLGLRAGEVVRLRLEDLDWKAGVLTVCGKGSQCNRLPIPEDVGDALATYLRQARPQCSSRRVFVNLRAPHRGFASSVAICSIMKRALARAGLNPARKGAHLLRHSLATDMLRKGASLVEIGQILNHQRPSTTEIYAKVELVSLKELAQPWPGGEA